MRSNIICVKTIAFLCGRNDAAQKKKAVLGLLSCVMMMMANAGQTAYAAGTESWRESALEDMKGDIASLLDQLRSTVTGRVYDEVSRKALSTEDYDNLLRIVEAEATGKDVEAKMMVACVVLNRVKDSRFPDTISKVVWDRSADGSAQFTPTVDGRFYSVAVTDGTREAVGRVIAGEDNSQGAMFFVSGSGNRSWFDAHLKYLFDCGGHYFYTFRENDPHAHGTVQNDE